MKKWIIIILVVAVASGVATGLFLRNRRSNSPDVMTDAKEFKKEYEEYNNKTDEYSSKKYLNVEIPDDNKIKYITEDEAIDIIKNKTGVIYFGFPTCPWCRAAIPTLLQAVENHDFGVLYYLNTLDIRSSLELDENDKAVTKKKGSDGYYKLLEALDEILTEYKLNNGKKDIKTGEKRLYAPTVVFIKDGKILANHVGTVQEHDEDPFKELSKNGKEELYNKYSDSIGKITDNQCEEGC